MGCGAGAMQAKRAQCARALHFSSTSEASGWPATAKLRSVPTLSARAAQSVVGRLVVWVATQDSPEQLQTRSRTTKRWAEAGLDSSARYWLVVADAGAAEKASRTSGKARRR